MVYHVGDIVKLKKPHPCGSHEWEILRVGADIRWKCMGWTSDYGRTEIGGEEYQRTAKSRRYMNISFRNMKWLKSVRKLPQI